MDQENDMKEINYEKWKIPISIYVTLFTLVFSFSGYLYAKTYFYHFGVKVERFFTLEDYLRNSIDQIYLIIITILLQWMFIAFFVNKGIVDKATDQFVDLAGKDTDTSPEKRIKRLRFIKKMLDLSRYVPAVICIVEFVWGGSERYTVYTGGLAFYLANFYPTDKDSKFWGLSRVESFIVIGLIGLVGLVFISANRSASLIKSGQVLNGDQYEFKVKKEGNLLHIGSTSQFLFMYDRKEHYTLIIPTSDLDSVKIMLK